MMIPIHKLLLAGALALVLSGCATTITVFDENPDNLIYSGTRRDLDGWTFAHGGFLDLPFSFVFDTILLPYTIPRTIWNYATDEEAADDRGGAGEDEAPGSEDERPDEDG